MPIRKNSWVDALSIRFAVANEKRKRKGGWRNLDSKRGMTLVLGAALSIGGTTEAFNGVHFLVQKDLDTVRVVRQKNGENRVVADLKGPFAANSVFKIASLVPDKYVSKRLNLFDLTLTQDGNAPLLVESARTLSEGFAMINNSIREQFFKSELPFGELIHRKAAKYHVDPTLVVAVMETESRFKTRARSHVGATGLMQLMPRTGRWMGAKNLYDPEQNVDAGVKYLKYLDGRFDGDRKKVIAAYNAGEGNVMKYGGTPPFNETRSYVNKVLTSYEKHSRRLEAFEEQADTSVVAR